MKVLTSLTALLILSLMLISCQNKSGKEQDLKKFIDKQLQFAVEQYKGMEDDLPDTLMPRTIGSDGKLITSNIEWWCSGFFPGTLWYLYEYSGDEQLRTIAARRTMILESEKYDSTTHDLGLMLYSSFGNAYRITHEPQYKDILETGALSLASRFSPVTGCIRSWDHGSWEFPVIIDNMMNLEYLYWAAHSTGMDQFSNIAVSHTNITMKNHFRPDYSSFHLVDYDSKTGQVTGKQTVQGYSDGSAWARGQSWGLYGFTVAFRETGDSSYLKQAKNIAGFLIGNPNMPADMIPYWDYNDPAIPDTYRDASAGAIMASALIELSDYCSGEDSARYINAAIKAVRTLGSEKYRASLGTNGHFILKHSVGHLPSKSEVDVPLTYADYYFVEALMRLRSRV